MKNKHSKQRKKNEQFRNKVRKILSREDYFEHMEKLAKDKLTDDELTIIFEVYREMRLQDLFEELEINENKLKKTMKKLIKLSPKSKKYSFISHLYKHHRGYYKVEDLMNEYYDSILIEGLSIGTDYGKKFIIEDIQNNRFTKEDIMNMSSEEMIDYSNEKREKI